jgi:sulfur carrier protein ThiS
MLSINVRTNTTRRTVSQDITATPKEVFNELGIDTSTSMVNLNGTILSGADFNKSFEELGVEDGTSANLNAIVKADGASF